MSTDFTEQGSRKKFARLVGGTYLLYIVTMVLADVFGNIGRSSVPELAAATSAGDLSFRVGLVFALVSALLFVLIAWGLYTLLRPVNKDLALLFLLLNAVGVAIQCVSMLPLISTMLQTEAVSQMQAFSPAQLSALGLLSAGTFKLVWVTAQLFFGAWLFPLGYLVYKSGILPRLLGALLLADGVGVMIWFLQALLFPDYAAVRVPGLAVSFVAEFGLALWLLVVGVRSPGVKAARTLSAPAGSPAPVS